MVQSVGQDWLAGAEPSDVETDIVVDDAPLSAGAEPSYKETEIVVPRDRLPVSVIGFLSHADAFQFWSR